MTLQELELELTIMRRRVRDLEARMPRSTRRSIGDRHDHQELRGRRISDSDPADGDVLQFSTTTKQWAPGSAGGAGGSAHVIQEDGANLAQEARLNFRQGLLAVDDAGNTATRVDADWATTADLANVAATESAGTATTVPRGDHVHGGAYTDTLARAAVPFTIYVPLGNSVLGQTHAPA